MALSVGAYGEPVSRGNSLTIEKAFGQLCWTLESNDKKIYVTIQGGNLTCDFTIGTRVINPFYILPWWNEPIAAELDNLSQLLRGDFFCLPFGADDSGDPVTYHGPTASGYWMPVDGNDDENSIDLKVGLDPGTVTKHVEIRPGEPVIYQRHTISGFEGTVPFGYHPMLRFPKGIGTGRITISPPLSGHTTPQPFEIPSAGGFSRITPGREISDMTAVPCNDGSLLDLTTYPHTPGYEELVMFVSDPALPFVFSAVTFPEQGYLYFQLKNPKTLRQTVFWMSNGGRWYPPWDGRVQGLLGLEEVTAFFHYGKSASAGKNFLNETGIPTSRQFVADEAMDIPLISGVVPTSPSFGRVRNIEQSGPAEITIQNEGNEKLVVACDPGFLNEVGIDMRRHV